MDRPFADIAPTQEPWNKAFESYAAQPAVLQASTSSYQGSNSNSAARKHAQQCAAAAWTSLECSLDGQKILVGTDDDYTLVLDAMSGDDTTIPPVVVHTPKSISMTGKDSFGCGYSADAKYVLCGNEDNGVGIFDVTGQGLESTGTEVATLNGHASPVGLIRSNPKYDVVATACNNVGLWIAPNA